MITPLITLIILIIPTISAPVRTLLCCCGCTQEPCPFVGPNCPDPSYSCNGTTTVKCSALQRLYDISQLKLTEQPPYLEIEPLEEKADNGKETTISIPDLDGEMSTNSTLELLPTLDSREVQSMKNDIIEITSNKTRKVDIRFSPQIRKIGDSSQVSEQMNSLHRISEMMTEMEGMLQLMKGEMKTHLAKINVLRDASPHIQIDSTLTPKRVRVTREKRAESDNCNDEKLRKLMKQNIKKDAKTSKREIQKAANKEFGGHFNVICSPCEFSFVVASQKYCDGFKDEVACFAFLQPPTKLKVGDDE